MRDRAGCVGIVVGVTEDVRGSSGAGVVGIGTDLVDVDRFEVTGLFEDAA